MHMHLAFATDGRVDHILGIAALLNRLALMSCQPAAVWIAAPADLHARVRHTVSGSSPWTPLCVDAAAEPDDPYGIQLRLGDIFRSVPAGEPVWALDHDHLVAGRVRAPRVDRGCIRASSEPPLPYRRRGGDIGWSLNVSMLAGFACDLARVADVWRPAYEDLSSHVSERHRGEAAFCWSAERCGVSLRRVPSAVQSNFAAAAAHAFLFHYGGDTAAALALKTELRRLSATPDVGCDAVHDYLLGTLRRFSQATPASSTSCSPPRRYARPTARP